MSIVRDFWVLFALSAILAFNNCANETLEVSPPELKTEKLESGHGEIFTGTVYSHYVAAEECAGQVSHQILYEDGLFYQTIDNCQQVSPPRLLNQPAVDLNSSGLLIFTNNMVYVRSADVIETSSIAYSCGGNDLVTQTDSEKIDVNLEIQRLRMSDNSELLVVGGRLANDNLSWDFGERITDTAGKNVYWNDGEGNVMILEHFTPTLIDSLSFILQSDVKTFNNVQCDMIAIQ